MSLLDEQEEAVQKGDLLLYQVENQYSVEQHVNPHDIVAKSGLVQAQQIELEKKKVS